MSRVPCGGDEGRFDGDVTPHHHLVCLSCGRIEDFTMPGADLDDLPPAVAAWGVPRDAQILVRGVCRACLSRMHNVNPQENQRSQSK